jgi:hypothetical protein
MKVEQEWQGTKIRYGECPSCEKTTIMKYNDGLLVSEKCIGECGYKLQLPGEGGE